MLAVTLITCSTFIHGLVLCWHRCGIISANGLSFSLLREKWGRNRGHLQICLIPQQLGSNCPHVLVLGRERRWGWRVVYGHRLGL
ncbi:hypothetical protein EDD16DRAFT_1618968 [Pisolithus croceorrhizus]|nr:hypothetical protein EDD16DRAFT_1618968 [Pisolithus croceorrhizus]